MVSQTAVVVTGGASGLGAAVAREFHEAGHHVHVFDIASSASDLDVPHTYHQVDVCDDDNVRAAFDAISATDQRLVGIVHCAGIAAFGPKNPGRLIDTASIEVEQNFDTVQRVISTNLIGTFSVVRHGAALIAKAGLQPDDENGFIILTSSGAALEGKAGQSAYSASKAAIIGMTLPLAREFSELGIRVVTIAPGLFDTPILADTPKIERHVPFPQRVGDPAEFAKLARHISENQYINADVIRIDGGTRGEFRSQSPFIR